MQVLIDADNKPSTGCRVITSLGNVDGIETIVTTTYDDTSLRVTDVSTRSCAQDESVNFSAPVQLSAGGWARAERQLHRRDEGAVCDDAEHEARVHRDERHAG
jgi:hypothetical protein